MKRSLGHCGACLRGVARVRRVRPFACALLSTLAFSACGGDEVDLWPAFDQVQGMALVLPGGSVRPFFLQRFEVTIAEYARFADASALPPLADLRARGDHPITWVRREEALAYLRPLGLRLPASQEWEAAAAHHLLIAPRTEATTDEIPLFTANSRETGVRGTVPVGFFEGDRTRDGIYDLAGNASEWTEGVFLLEEDGSYLLAPPESYRHALLDLAALGGVDETELVAARLDEIARRVRYVRVHGQSFVDELMPAGANLPRVRTDRLVHHLDALSTVGFRGACDAVERLALLGAEAEGRPERLERLAAWLDRLPPGADGVLRRLLREREDALAPSLVRLARARLGE
ncbi:MAG: SUMF1/EgtB/PvdO family nonheme iron enzyme [Planctomycetes bacterium]|nr:SUMF1/EgtB/PvdO family nonheme iron enzyme [Planctomycetota bacterium]